MPSIENDGLVTLTELKHFVDALDGAGNGIVDYTLLVAANLPPEVYCEEKRIMEIFDQFDFKKQGNIGPEDLLTFLRTAIKTKDVNLKYFSEMVAEFDMNNDGMLNLEEFRYMLKGSETSNESGNVNVTERLFYHHT